jgi:Rieske 2Fe-2S family protein
MSPMDKVRRSAGPTLAPNNDAFLRLAANLISHFRRPHRMAMRTYTMDVTATLSLGDPLEPARKATADAARARAHLFAAAAVLHDERLFDIDMQEIFQKEWLIAGMTCEIPAKGNYLTLQSARTRSS